MPIDGKVGDKPVTPAPTLTYCTVADVALVLQQPEPSEAAGEGEPTQGQWKTAIRWAEARVDRFTRRSWRPRQVRLEYHGCDSWVDEEAYYAIRLRNAPVKPLASASGDVIEVWNGSAWDDWLTSHTEGRQNDYWLQEDEGVLRLRRLLTVRSPNARARASYRYGVEDIPEDITEATALLAAIRLGMGDAVMPFGRGGEIDRLGMDPKIRMWYRDAYALVAQYQAVGGGL